MNRVNKLYIIMKLKSIVGPTLLDHGLFWDRVICTQFEVGGHYRQNIQTLKISSVTKIKYKT